MALSEQELTLAYQDLIKAYPEDLRIARPLIHMLQSKGEVEEARDLAMKMARRMVALGYSSYALAFLSICEQLDHPDTDEIESMKAMAELTLGSQAQSLSESGKVFELIEALSDSESKIFLEQGTFLHAKLGDEIVKQGDESQKFYLILEGDIRVRVQTKSGDSIEVGQLKSGDFFGEVACVYQFPRTATVIANSDTTLLEFSAETIDEIMRTSPIAGDSLMKVVQRRMLETVSFTHPAFAGLGDEDRKWLEEDSELVEYFPKKTLNADKDSQYFYVLVFGKAVAFRDQTAKCGLGVNAMFGDVSPILRFPDGTTLKSTERCLACKMPIQIFETFYNTYAGFELWVKSHVEARNKKLLTNDA